MNFTNFRNTLQNRFDSMNQERLFITDTTKDEIWKVYLDSFPEGSNPIYNTNTEHDCNCCKGFIRKFGNVVDIVDNKLVSIWDFEIEGPYGVVAKAMAKYVKSKAIRSPFFHYENFVGTTENHAEDKFDSSKVKTWNHFYVDLPDTFVTDKDNIGTACAKVINAAGVAFRGFTEITPEATETVLDLIAQNSIYRGEEFKTTVEKFRLFQTHFLKLNTDKAKVFFAWNHWPITIRNSVIGTLLVDLSDGVELNKAVGSYEAKVAPTNYKRTTALITPGMISKAEEKVEALGIKGALSRRYASINDITINNILFANHDATVSMGVFDDLKKEAKTSVPKNLDKIEEISIKDFVSNILPNISKAELLVENKHNNNFVSLIAPVDASAGNMLKWNNNFSWSYNGEVTDSIKERVKKAGGDVTGDLRFSLSWFNSDDLDIHVREPQGGHICYSRKYSQTTEGRLDVDMNVNGRDQETPVENITWPSQLHLSYGKYEVYVNQYTKRDTSDIGFEVEMDFLGDTKLFTYDKALPNKSNVTVCEFEYSENGIKILNSLPLNSASKTIWNVPSQKFVNVSVIMNSPNHWDNQETGNKHYFFMLENCANEGSTRGFYNEFLDNRLTEHRKVFEVLSSKTKVAPSSEQLSGLGFSSTQRNSVICKVSGSFNRTVKINF